MRAATWLALAAPLLGQGPAATVSVSAPAATVVCAAAMQLRATSRDSAGVARANDNFVWSSSNGNIVEVSAGGTVTGKALGHADITAAVGNIRGTIRIQVLPARIVVKPESADLVMFQTQSFTASALDASGAPIAGATIDWQVLNAGGNQQNSAVISTAGLFRATVTGQFTIRATVAYSAGIGFVTQYSGTARVRVTPELEYRMKRLLTSDDVRENPRLRLRRGNLAAPSGAEVWFPASLDGVNSGYVRWLNGRLDVMVTAGLPGPAPGTVITDFNDAAAGGGLGVLLRASMLGSGAGMLAITAAGPAWVHADGGFGGGADAQSGASMTPFSFASAGAGAVVFRANFRLSGTEDTVSGFLRKGIGQETPSMLLASSDRLASLKSPVTIEDGFGTDAAGNLWFRASDASKQAILRRDGATGAVSEVVATGAALAGSTLRTIYGGHNPAVGSDGVLTVMGQLSDGRAVMMRWRSPAAAAEVVEAGVNNLYASTPGVGTLFIGNTAAGFGVHRWRLDGTLEALLLRNRPGAVDEPLTDFYACTAAPDGTVFVSASGVETPWLLIRIAGADVRVIAAQGAVVNGAAPLAPFGIVRGDRTGGLHLTLSSGQHGLFEHTPDGAMPRLLPGDRLPGGALVRGDYGPRKSATAEVYMGADAGMYRLSDDAVVRLFSFPLELNDGVLMWSTGAHSVMAAGRMLLIGGTSSGHSRIVLAGAGAPETLAMWGSGEARFQTALPGGGIVSGWAEAAVNENGQVMAVLRRQNAPNGLYLWEKGAWSEVCVPGRCTIFDNAIATIDNLHAAGEYFYARFSTGNLRRTIARWSAREWTPLLDFGDTLPNAATAGNYNLLDGNRRGDALVLSFDGGTAVLVVNESSKKTVHSLTRLTEEGDLLRNVHAAELRDDGRVYLLVQDYFDRLMCYVAIPAR